MKPPQHLIDAQQQADTEHARLRGLDGSEWDAQWARWREAATGAHMAVTGYAAGEGLPRCEVEAAVKRAVRHPG